MNVSCKSVSKVYGQGIFGVKELSLEIESGEFLVIMGESGCGKSTLLRLLSGVYKPDGGELYIDGIPATSLPAQDRDCAMIFQDYSLYPNLSVYDNVGFYLKRQGLTPEELKTRILPIIEFMGLKNYVNVKPKFLSGGQQQRVCLAKALVRRPKLLLFDEPLSNVDERSRDKYLRLIKETKKLLPHTTFVYVTHNSHEAKFLADRIAVMLNGKIVDIGTVDELCRSPQILDTVYLLGENPTVINGKIESGKFIGEKEFELEEYSLATYDGKDRDMVFCALNSFGFGYNYYFDQNSNAVAGYKKQVELKASIYKGKISFQNQKFNLSEVQTARYIGLDGDVNLKINLEKLHKVNCRGDFSVELKKEKCLQGLTVFSTGQEKIALKGEYDDGLTLYYSIEDIMLTDSNGNNLITKYAVYPNACEGKISGDLLKIAKNKFDIKAKSGYYNIEILPTAFISVCKKQKNTLFIKECLAEDTLGTNKLIHCLVDGFNNYVTLQTSADIHLLKRKNFFVLLDTSQIRIAEND